jgi:hypothetical protein
MESAKLTLLDQARASRGRAQAYRQLAKRVANRLSLASLEKCARDLEDRAMHLERWAAEFDRP